MADLPIIKQLLTFWHGASSGGGEGGACARAALSMGRNFS